MQENKQESPRTSSDPWKFGRAACRKRCRDRNRKGTRALKPECGFTYPCQNLTQTVAVYGWSDTQKTKETTRLV